MRDELKRLEAEFAQIPQVVFPEKTTSDARNRPLAHPNPAIQGMVEKARKDAVGRQQLLKAKRQELERFERDFYEEMSHFRVEQPPDENQESQSFHLVDDYDGIQRNKRAEKTEPTGPQPVEVDEPEPLPFLQAPQRADFSILIGHFDHPTQDYLHDPIQSYYKQFVSSDHALYFFKFPDETEVEGEISTLSPQLRSGAPPRPAP